MALKWSICSVPDTLRKSYRRPMPSLLNEDHHFIRIAAFGELSIQVTPQADDPEICHVDIGAETRIDAMSMTTNRDETIDQFTARVRSMLRALANAQPREAEMAAPPKKKDKSWVEQKAELKSTG